MKTLKLTYEDIFKGYLILVNPFYAIKNDISENTLIPLSSDFPKPLLESQTASMLSKLMEKLESGQGIVPVSGYRTMQEQQKIYSDSLHERGEAFTEKYVAIPGCSEHQTGLAIDLAEDSNEIDFICPSFPYDGICGQFRKLAPRYGFIERYPQGKEAITGIAYEPWHFRYIGVPHAEIITQNTLTLEEYTEYLKQYTYDSKHLFIRCENQSVEVFYAPVPKHRNIEIIIPDNEPYQISGNNADGIVVTLWRGKK